MIGLDCENMLLVEISVICYFHGWLHLKMEINIEQNKTTYLLFLLIIVNLLTNYLLCFNYLHLRADNAKTVLD